MDGPGLAAGSSSQNTANPDNWGFLSSKMEKLEETAQTGATGSSSQNTANGAGCELEAGVVLLSSNIANDENGLLSAGAWMTAVFSGDGRMLSLEATLILPRLPCACNSCVNRQCSGTGGVWGTLIMAVGDRARAELKAFTADLVPMVGEV